MASRASQSALLRDVIAFADTDASVAPGITRSRQTGNFIAGSEARRLSEAKLARRRDQFLRPSFWPRVAK